MKTFDYVSAWHTAAKPAYLFLPADVRDLLERTATTAADLGQLADCSMPWPDPENDPQNSEVSGVQGFRAAFQAVPADTLALASRAIYSIGHWFPAEAGRDFQIPGRENGAHWKFSHYADQELRLRLELPERGDGGRTPNGLRYAIHEGAIRICYSSDHGWTWAEVAPATPTGLETARGIASKIRAAYAGINRSHKSKRDSAAFDAFERLKADPPVWPEEWRPFVETDRFMIEEDAFRAREAAVPAKREKTRADLVARFEQTRNAAIVELEGMLWILDHGLSIDNVIYYGHTGRFCFGWRDKVSAAVVSQILDVISEFPHPYTIKAADGRTLEGC